MKRLLMFILTLSALCATAQEIQIKGDVSSVLTREGVSRAVVRLMTMDGETVLATDTTRYQLITERGDHWSNTLSTNTAVRRFRLSRQPERAICSWLKQRVLKNTAARWCLKMEKRR